MTTTTIQTSEELEAQIDDLRQQHQAATERVDRARDVRQDTAGRRVLGEADEEELAAAQAALSAAEDEASSLASALALVESRHQDALGREREERRTALASEADAAGRRRAKAVRALDKALASVRDAFAGLDDESSDRSGIRQALVALDDPTTLEEAIDTKYRALVEEAERSTPPGLVVNYGSFEFRRDREVAAMREGIAARAASVAPVPEDDDLAAVVDAYSDLAPRLLDSSTRAVLAQGAEFLQHPIAARGVSDNRPVGNTSQRLYGEDELDRAYDRFDEMQSLIGRLAGPLPRRDARHRKVA